MPEGDGNVLDRSLIFGTSEHADGGSHDYTDHPFLLLGGAAGAIRAGMHYRHPDNGNRDGPRMLLTGVRAVGVPRERIGQQSSDGPRIAIESVSEIEA
jgi:hypothetical protein